MVYGITRALAAVGLAGVLSVAGAAAAQASTGSWGQEVKACNTASCYPGGSSRGVYVRAQANDSQGPGYAWEIHHLAFPGKSSPSI